MEQEQKNRLSFSLPISTNAVQTLPHDLHYSSENTANIGESRGPTQMLRVAVFITVTHWVGGYILEYSFNEHYTTMKKNTDKILSKLDKHVNTVKVNLHSLSAHKINLL